MAEDLLYVASSWRNSLYDSVIAVLKAAQINYYDFKHPRLGEYGFHWSEIDFAYKDWTPRIYREALHHPLAEHGFQDDHAALVSCTRLLLVLPCGRSSHLELGHAIGAGKPTIIYMPEDQFFEPELMYKEATYICVTILEVLEALGVPN